MKASRAAIHIALIVGLPILAYYAAPAVTEQTAIDAVRRLIGTQSHPAASQPRDRTAPDISTSLRWRRTGDDPDVLLVSLTVHNRTPKTIVAYKVEFYFTNQFGERLEAFGFGRRYRAEIVQGLHLGPGEVDLAEFRVAGFEDAYAVQSNLYEVLFADGSRWEGEHESPR